MADAAETHARPRGSLVKSVGDSLRTQIASGKFAVGDRLPSQADLTEEFDVSRSVVREAVVGLQSAGLVEARHGAGVFVTASKPASTGLMVVDVARVSSILEMLELRAAVEVEAAALAALRRSPQQEDAIFLAHEAVSKRVASGEHSADADFVFHRSIAAATNNPRFLDLLDLLGQNAIPDMIRHNHLDKILEEHLAIARAISNGAEDAARDAMRFHIRNSQQRYRSLARGDAS